jgi:hypothetical protein
MTDISYTVWVTIGSAIGPLHGFSDNKRFTRGGSIQLKFCVKEFILRR